MVYLRPLVEIAVGSNILETWLESSHMAKPPKRWGGGEGRTSKVGGVSSEWGTISSMPIDD